MENKDLKDHVDDIDSDVRKAYKEKPYLNSNKEPFGLTLNGKSKEYIDAKGLLIKGKEIATLKGKIKILDATLNKAMVNTIVEIVSTEGVKGNAELKVYNPSLNKKKGATMEIRKVSDFEYVHVENLRNVLTGLLDSVNAGDVAGFVNTGIKNKIIGKVTSKPKLFTCDVWMETWLIRQGKDVNLLYSVLIVTLLLTTV